MEEFIATYLLGKGLDFISRERKNIIKDLISIRNEIYDEYVKENSPYHVIFCKIRKRDEKKFLDALSEMYDKMLLMGYKDYQEVCDNFIRVVEKNEKEK